MTVYTVQDEIVLYSSMVTTSSDNLIYAIILVMNAVCKATIYKCTYTMGLKHNYTYKYIPVN